MTVYIVLQVKVEDPETYRQYTQLTPALIKRHGGRFLTRGGDITTQEGEPFTDRMVILEFPSKFSFETFYNDPDYAEAVKIRHAASVGSLLVQEGVPLSTDAPEAQI